MIIRRSVEHRINMGPYESVTLGASVELNTDEVGGTTDKALDLADQLLDDAVEADVKEARKHAVDESYVLNWRN